MNRFIYTFAFVVSILLSPSLMAKDIETQATGHGTTYKLALFDAIDNAITQTSGVSIKRDKPLKNIDMEVGGAYSREKSNVEADNDNFQIKNDTDIHKAGAYYKDNSVDIPAQYEGAIKSYYVVSEEQKDGVFIVTIMATVFQEDVYDSHDYQSKDLIKKSNYSLAIMPFDFRHGFNCLGQKVSNKEFNTILSNLFVEKISDSKKFNLVDRENQKNYEKEMAIIAGDMTLPENKVRLKNLVSADYILVGSIENFSATTNKKYIELTGENIYNSSSAIKISYRLLETATMEIISSDSSEKTFNKKGQFSSCYNVENHLLKQAVSETVNRLLKDVFPNYKPAEEEKPKKTSVSSHKQALPRPVIALPFD